MGIPIKKSLKYTERDPEKRIIYFRKLREILKTKSKDQIVYIDESGFEAESTPTSGWGPKGKKVPGNRRGSLRSRINLIAGKAKRKLLAPFLYKGSTDSIWFNQWLKDHLFKELKPQSVVIMDNAAFHKTSETRKIFEESQHQLLYLPPYSPDLNPIEKVFALLKKKRRFAPPDSTLESIIKLTVL